MAFLNVTRPSIARIGDCQNTFEYSKALALITLPGGLEQLPVELNDVASLNSSLNRIALSGRVRQEGVRCVPCSATGLPLPYQ